MPFKSTKQLAESVATGTTFKEVSGSAFSKMPVPLPPTAEPHRIVAKIETLFSELDQGVASLKTAREQLKVYRQSLLKNAFEGKLTAATAREKSLGQLLGFLTSGSRGWAAYYATSGDLFVRAQNIKHDRLELDDVAFVWKNRTKTKNLPPLCSNAFALRGPLPRPRGGRRI